MKKEKKTKEKERGRKIDQENWTDEGHPGYLPNISLARKIVFGLHVFTCTLFCWESVGCGVTWNEEPVDSISVEADNTANGSAI